MQKLIFNIRRFIIVPVLLFFLLPGIAYSQTSIDSLLNELEVSLKQNNHLSVARIYYRLGKYYDLNEMPVKSDSALQKALFYAEKSNSEKAIAVVSNYLAGNLSQRGKNDEAIELYQSSGEKFLSLGDTVLASNVYLNLGITYLDIGDFKKALETKLFALKIREQSGDSNDIARFYQKVGEVYKELNMTRLWGKYLNIASRLAEQNPDYASFLTRMALLNDLAALKMIEGDTLSGLDLYRKMYRESAANGYVKGKFISLVNMSNFFLETGNQSTGVEMAKSAYRLAHKIRDKYNLIALSNHIGENYLEVGNYQAASDWFKKALQLSKGSYPDESMRAYKGLYESLKKVGMYEKSLLYLEKYITVKDSIENAEIQKKVRELEEKYQNEKKNAVILSLNQQNIIKDEKLRAQQFFIVIIFLIVILTGIVAYYTQRQYRLKAQNKEIILQQRLLRSQMNPHFIFNSLGFIQSFMYSNDGGSAAKYLGKFASLMRDILNHSRKNLISLEEEINLLNNYLEIQKLRKSFQYEISCAEDIDPKLIKIPPLLIQPFVENAIKHGINELGDKGRVYVRFDVSDNHKHLLVEIEDNGPGIHHSSKGDPSGNSVSINIFKDRMRFLQMSEKEKFAYHFIDLKEETGRSGTLIKLVLPLISEE